MLLIQLLTIVLALAGEWSYLFLSLFSKGLLGIILLFNVIIYSSLDEALAEAS